MGDTIWRVSRQPVPWRANRIIDWVQLDARLYLSQYHTIPVHLSWKS